MRQTIRAILDRAARIVMAIEGKRLGRRIVSIFLIQAFLASQGAGFIQSLKAETGGATAPEVTKFEPVDTTDLVNLASGDFSYTIPILNVPGPEGGYPLALGYHAGIQHGEEASWVGLGWNLQPGSISRAVKGYPDDFKSVGINTNYRSNIYETYSVGVSFGGVQAGVNYTTYRGYSGYVGYGIGISYNFFAASASVGISALATISSEGVGATVAANASVSLGPVSAGVNASVDSKGNTSSGSSIGVSINASGYNQSGEANGWHNSLEGAGKVQGKTGDFQGSSASFSNYNGGGNHSESFGIGISFCGFGVSASYTRSWIDKNEWERAYGYYYHVDPIDNSPDTEDPEYGSNHHTKDQNRVDEWTMESDPTVVPGDSKEHALAAGLHYLVSSDGYAVMGQGTGGSLKLTRLEDRVYRPKKIIDEWNEGSSWPWNGVDQSQYKPRFVFDGDNTENILNPESIGALPGSISSMINTNTNSTNPSASTQIDANSITAAAQELFLGKKFEKGSRIVKESVDSTGLFQKFDVWEVDGKRYTYGEPVYNFNSTSIAANRPTIGTGEWFRSKSQINQPYAYAWYLSELRYPDYFDINNNGLSDEDHGGWVKFGYVVGSPYYNWHTSPDGQLSDGPVNRIDKLGKDKAGMMYSMQYGSKELKYLNMIETATHRAIFATSPRLDGKDVRPADSAAPQIYAYTSKVNGTTDEFQINTSSDPALLGIKISANQWQLIPEASSSNTIQGGPCDGRSDTVSVYRANFDGQLKSFSIGGVPLLAYKVERNDIVNNFENGGIDGSTWCETSYQTNYTITIRLSDQFWNQAVLNVPANQIFPEIWNRWNNMQNKSVTVGSLGMLKLDDIYLIEKSTNTLVKQVHFYYSYRLAPGTPNTDRTSVDSSGNLHNSSGGKLTLEAVQTFGQGGRTDASVVLPPYLFEYGNNPGWGTKYSFDRWGYFKSDGGPWNHRDVNGADQSAWSLTKITLPTGGTIQVQYEPKDYTRVQDRVPLNPRANAGQVSQYLVDLAPWATTTAWPITKEEWDAFNLRVRGDASHDPVPFHLFTPTGQTLSNGVVIKPAITTLSAQSTIPIESAPNTKDLKLWLVKAGDPTYTERLAQVNKVASIQSDNTFGVPDGDPTNAKQLEPSVAAVSTSTAPVERMVNIIFEYWTAGARAQKRLGQPNKLMSSADITSLGDDDRGDSLVQSALVRMVRKKNSDGSDNGADMFVTDPSFVWPKEAPDSMYVTWTSKSTTPKLGGGVRVKRVVSSDGRRTFSTSYTYTDWIDGAWTSSGVAAQEPPPFGYSAMDDRVIYTEKGGWANESGGGIYHSRVVVRHSWSEDPAPSGALMSDGATRAYSPAGESVFRFITPRDLPHQQKEVEYANSVSDPAGNTYTNSARITEIFNVGSWWGKLLWKEDRDSTGHPLNRVENRYTQLEGYLHLFPDTGYDPDVEKVWGQAPRPDMSYHWADHNTTRTDGSTPLNLPLLVDKADNLSEMGKTFPVALPGYLNASVNVTIMNITASTRNTVRSYAPKTTWYSLTQDPTGPILDPDLGTLSSDPSTGGWHSSLVGVREISFAPLVSEVRTYGEGEKLLSVVRNTKWDRRTGAVVEKEERGRRTQTVTDPAFESDLHDPFQFHDRNITRTWPAYWQYSGMDTFPDPTDPAFDPSHVTHMLSQIGQVTSLRKKPDGTEVFLNSKVDTWWQPSVNSQWGSSNQAWMKGGAFVWNGLGTGSNLVSFPGFRSTGLWTPESISTLGLQPYKNQEGWIFAGATTHYDAFVHPIEALDGDGIYGCSKYGYPYYSTTGVNPLPAGNLPIAKFANAKDEETLYYNFEGSGPGSGPLGTSFSDSPDPLVRLGAAYTGERAYNGTLPVTIPPSPQTDGYELRYFVKAANQQAALDSCQSATSWKQAVPAEGGWWLVRIRAASGQVNIAGLLDDVSVFPWRKNGAPCSVSHYAYDRALGLVTSITGSNGRTTRYRYDRLGRLMGVYDVYGKPSATTRYANVAPTTVVVQ